MRGKIVQEKVKIIANQRISKEYFKITLRSLKIASWAHPGEFIEIKIADSYTPLLRRPFSLHRVRDNKIEILYQVVGKGSEILSQKKAGEYLDVIGPLGSGFTYQAASRKPQAAILVAGGIGVAPLIFLAEKLAERRTLNSELRTIVLIGAKTKNEVLCEKEFKKLGYAVKISTDDGSRGFKGYVSELLDKELSTMNHGLSTIYACGPRLMLKEISAISKQYKIPAQVSLEEHMACGTGACLGCVVKTKNGFQRVCKEGPVFDAQEIIW